ncbi:MAG: insulinase family protein [Treponemataceae bacterium]|nr:insulinase family protein [Treponemataceae bacterium]
MTQGNKRFGLVFFVILAFSCFFPASLFSQDLSLQTSASGTSLSSSLSSASVPNSAYDVLSGLPGFYHGQLDNGLDVYFLEDYSSPAAAFCFAVKAGTSVQTPLTTGISELCTRIFFSASGGQEFFYDNGAFTLDSECSGDYALYSSIFSADRIDDILSGLARCVETTNVSEAVFLEHYSAMLEKAKGWGVSSESYINGSMDGIMFPSYPWSRETGLDPEAFISSGSELALDKVLELRRKYYVPDNSALFLCGPFSPDHIAEIVVSFFSDWKAGETVPLGAVWEEGKYSLADVMSWEGKAAAALRQELHGLRLGTGPGGSQSDGGSGPGELNGSGDSGLDGSGPGGGGLYVLSSDSFSKDFNQLIVQYVLDNPFLTATQAAAAETAVALFEQGSAFKSLVLADEDCGVKSADWLYSSILRQQSGSRLVFQAIAENKGNSPGKQALAFARCIEKPEVFSQDEIAYFSRITADRLTLLRRDPYQFIHSMAEDWGFCNPYLPELADKLQEEGFPRFSFSKAFFEPFSASLSREALSLTSDDLYPLLDGDPYVFLLLNDEVYAQHKDSLESSGFIYIPKDSGEWYKTEGGKSALRGEGAASFSELVIGKLLPLLSSELLVEPDSFPAIDAWETEESLPPLEEKSGLQNYIDYGKNAFGTFSLSNGIPVIVQNGTTSSFSFKLMFSGKKAVLSAAERDSQLVISDVIANNIKEYILMSGYVPCSEFSVSTESKSYGTIIDISTTADYAEPVLRMAAEALFFGDISAPRVDECAYARRSEWGMKLADGDFQLHAAAMASLCEESSEAGFFDSGIDFFSGVVFQDIEVKYLEMIDASSLSLALCGKDADTFLPLLDDLFGFLMNFSRSGRGTSLLSSDQLLPENQVRVALRRIFTSSVKPGEYVVQPEKLIPTEIFYDPLHIYFQCPPLDSPDYAVFMALVYELEEILDGMWEGGVLSSSDFVRVPVAGIWFHGVTQASVVYELFSEAVEVLQCDFDEERIKVLCDRYIERFYNGVKDTSSLTMRILEGNVFGGDGSLYLKTLEALKTASADDFAAQAAAFSTMPLLKSLSQDTK